jgi:imidazolonepropionase-like amidohydrolase
MLLAGSAHAQGTVAFVNASVIPVEPAGVLSNHTVVVRDGRIIALGPSASTPAPQGATVIDARGRFLTPGLAEMHGHVVANAHPQNPEWPQDVLFLYVAAGATTVRGMQGNPALLQLRERVRSGELIGPRLYLSGPPISGNNASDAASAEQLVRAQKAAGYDLLKVHEGIPADAYQALARTAREVDIPWGGHVSVFVGVPGALAARQSTIDHLDDYIDAAQRDDSPALSMSGGQRQNTLPMHIDNAKIPQLARATKEAGVAVVPTMALWEVLRGAHAPESFADRPELRYVPPQIVQAWTNQARNANNNTPPEVARNEVAFRKTMLKALVDAGVPVLMGTDAPQVFSVPGFSLHREIAVMAESGMTARQILESGTIAVARHFNDAEAGSIVVGKRADLLLLDANPLDDSANLGRISGVMVGGRWLSGEVIRERLGRIAARY